MSEKSMGGSNTLMQWMKFYRREVIGLSEGHEAISGEHGFIKVIS